MTTYWETAHTCNYTSTDLLSLLLYLGKQALQQDVLTMTTY